MPSNLVLQANHLNQLMGKYICPFHYVSWDSEKLEWKYENTNVRRMWPYYTVIGLNFLYVFLYITTIPIVLYWKDTEQRFNLHHVVLGGIIVLITIFLCPSDWLLIRNGWEWVYLTNWVFKCEGIIQSCDCCKYKIGQNHHRKIVRLLAYALLKPVCCLRNNLDWIGLAFNYVVMVYPVIALILAFFYGFGKFDCLHFLYPEMSPMFTFLFSAIRKVYFFLAFQWIFLNGRACLLITLEFSVTYVRILGRLKQKPVSTLNALPTLIRFYRELSIVLSLIFEHMNTMIGACLSGGYLTILLGTCCAVWGVKQDSYKLFFTFSGLTMATFCAVRFIFLIGDFLQRTSQLILKRWEIRCMEERSFKTKLLIRQVKCSRLLISKAGKISMISKSLEESYLNAVLQDSMTLLLICSSYWQLI